MASERNSNMVPSLQVKSNAGNDADVILWADPTTHRLLVDATLTGGGTSMTDDAAFTPGTTAITPMGAFFDDVAPDSVNEGDGGVVRMSGNRNLYVQLRDAAGNERGANVNASNELLVALSSVPSHAVTNAGTFAVQESGAALTALQLIDDVIKTDDAAFTPATDKVAMIGAQFDDTGTDSVDEGDAGAIRMSGRRELYTQIRDAAGNERGANVNASNQLLVTGPVTNAGTFAVQESGAALTALQLIDDTVYTDDAAFTPATSKVLGIGFMVDDTGTDSVDEGDIGAPRMSADRVAYFQGAVAHDAADSGNPVKVGGKAVNAEPTAVANADRANFITDLVGKLITLPYANPENFVSGTTAAMTGTTSTQLIAAPAAGLRNYITQIIVTNSHATVSTFVTIRDGDGGTVLYQAYALAAGGGFSITFPVPLRQPTTATRLDVKNETTGANTIANATGYKGA